MRLSWTEAVAQAVRRYTRRTGDDVFSRQELIDFELPAIVAATGSAGATPHQMLSRELQQLRDAGVIEFVDQGTYRWIGDLDERLQTGPTKGVFLISPGSTSDEIERIYRLPARCLASASRMVGGWVLYQQAPAVGDRGFYAVGQVDRLVPDPSDDGVHLALIRAGSFLEFGRDVPVELLGRSGERNDARARQPVRAISDADFNRIVELGLVDDDELLPRSDHEEPMPLVHEERVPWTGPLDRSTMLVSRTVRNRQFRKRILDAYGSTCALTGMRLINGGGRAEAQAAHIMSVEAGGPDAIGSGIALSGTVHWMFDRGLISLSDEGDILLSRKINDIDSVERLINRDRKARLPKSPLHRPHSRYLAWHQRECFHG